MFLSIAFRVSHSAVTVLSCAGGIGGGGGCASSRIFCGSDVREFVRL